ncbi:nickel pincer cofactor biosynthesis protein LarB [Deferribacterales bacterium RsTz2092]|nr:1-(5-phosphoribosyl)-5-amino-4-imidazole-carboxylate carboxylase [Deferribacterales bacterium]
MKDILNRLASGQIDVATAEKALSDEDVGFAKIDHARLARTGYPEVIYGAGKTPEQATTIFSKIAVSGSAVICTRATKEMADSIIAENVTAIYHSLAGIVTTPINTDNLKGSVVVVTGGTADIPVAEEAALILEVFGSRAERLYDVGVAGIHRLLARRDALNKANCIIAIAGMEGALPSVISGLVKVPVIAVPTSVGYGANLHGITTLLSMLCSCAAGVSVVNIDNGFGAAYQADMINKLALGVNNGKV